MRIQEHACESKICLSKFQFNCDEGDSSVPKPLPQNLNHFMLIVGKPGSSKTTLLLNLMCIRLGVDGGFYCNVCDAADPPGQRRRCDACDYDICHDCWLRAKPTDTCNIVTGAAAQP